MSPRSSIERGARVFFPPPLVFVSGLLLGVACRFVVGPPRVPVDSTICLIGGLLVLLMGTALMASARILFMRSGQSPAPWKPTQRLFFEGPYRFTRNPMYLGATLAMVGLGLAINNLWISSLALPALLVVHIIAVRPEERYLSEKFGESYKKYLAQVRRYV